MIKNKTLEKLMRFLITLLGAGLGAGAAAVALLFLRTGETVFDQTLYAPLLLYIGCGLAGAAAFFLHEVGGALRLQGRQRFARHILSAEHQLSSSSKSSTAAL